MQKSDEITINNQLKKTEELSENYQKILKTAKYTKRQPKLAKNVKIVQNVFFNGVVEGLAELVQNAAALVRNVLCRVAGANLPFASRQNR